ncbi:LRR receptor-like serine/threonine-protein kinase GSO2-like [Planoprotostelium fungivorum]|uniref:LRR receptor-like serine/threonine-protein kinase GSO2-like n=1 Tax=Planoprotostelium fungivorum TaxID=1890364 RepID=A0A2P6ND37_9EUKA|nr:LRR receptor-like serine/threonine-protein kinase GSO2-like [Planoprotostelium fungivorum]
MYPIQPTLYYNGIPLLSPPNITSSQAEQRMSSNTKLRFRFTMEDVMILEHSYRSSPISTRARCKMLSCFTGIPWRSIEGRGAQGEKQLLVEQWSRAEVGIVFGEDEGRTLDQLIQINMSRVRQLNDIHDMQNRLLLVFLIVGLASSRDLRILKQFFNETGGPHWFNNTGWNETDVCAFYGVQCRNGSVSSLTLDNNNLLGEITALTRLPALTHLSLTDNVLKGSIPVRINTCTSLEVILLRNNSMSGSIPAAIFDRLTSLRHLDLSSNGFSRLPSSLFNSTSIEMLNVEQNEIDGTEIDFENMTNLREIRLSQNKYRGAIPSSLCDLPHLKVVALDGNRFSGVIPTCLFHSSTLQVFNVSNNKLHGGLPPVTAPDFIPMKHLNVAQNRLSGEIPRSWARMVNLTTLVISENRLVGNLTGIFQEMNDLQVIDISFNGFTGPLPDVFQKTTHLFASFNTLDGFLPPSLFSNKEMKHLDLQKNRLMGTLPDEIGQMTSLEVLNLAQCNFGGPIPSSIGNLKHLRYLTLSRNSFTGAIPASLGNLSSLYHLSLFGNQLFGEIPPEFGDLQNMSGCRCTSPSFPDTSPELSLGLNNLSGMIPKSFSRLQRLSSLQMDNNPYLGGDLQFLEHMPNISTVRATRCNFNGNLPSCISDMEGLTYFDVANNNLTGRIPEFHPEAPIQIIRLHHNHFSGVLPMSLGSSVFEFDASYNLLEGWPSIRYRNTTRTNMWKSYTQLITLVLSHNRITNSMQGEEDIYGNQSLTSLQEFDISYNQLSGEIDPQIFYNLPSIQELRISHNRLSGSIDMEREGMPDLRVLDLSHNRLSGFIPSGINFCRRLQEVNLSHNQFSDTFSTLWKLSSNLQVLDLSHNDMYGQLPPSTGAIPNIKKLFLDYNAFTGYIPKELGQLIYLEELGLSHNSLVARDLHFLSSATKLVHVDLSYNQIATTLPRDLASSIEVLQVTNNRLRGELPDAIFLLRNLRVLRLAENSLNGSVQHFHGDPKILDLSSNGFSGSISFVSQLASTTTLFLQKNRFTGEVPLLATKSLIEFDISHNSLENQLPDFDHLNTLSRFNATFNSFNGSVPKFGSSLSRLDLSHNQLTSAWKMKLPDGITCLMNDNSFHCPVSWQHRNDCRLTCEVKGDNEPKNIDFHMEGDVQHFNSENFLRTLSRLGNVTEKRLSIPMIKSGSVIATVHIDPPSPNDINQGSVSDTILLLHSIDHSVWSEAGYNLLDPIQPSNTTININSPQIGGIVGGILGGFIVLGFITGVVFFLYSRKMKREAATRQLNMIDTSQLNTLTVKKSLIDYDEFQDVKKIGVGAFGIVYVARWRETHVAVKQIRAEYVTQKQLEDFLHEVAILQRLKAHPNIVMFIGMTFPPQPLSLVTEFCAGGALFDHLRKNKCTMEDKIKFIGEISLGMLHLHKEKIIHRDLAVRNILLSKHLEAKVADFGLSREQENTDSASQTQTTFGPLKWMAPEAISSRQYSIKSDVKEPWGDIDQVVVAMNVMSKGARLDIPQDCPSVLARLMELCWMTNRDQRPDFKEICSILLQRPRSEHMGSDDDSSFSMKHLRRADKSHESIVPLLSPSHSNQSSHSQSPTSSRQAHRAPTQVVDNYAMFNIEDE